MHEIAIASAIFDLVSRQAEQLRGQPGQPRITGVVMSVGGLMAVEPSTVRSCFELLLDGSGLEGVALTIRRRPVQLFCADCCGEQPADAQMRCGKCGGGRTRLAAQQGMMIERMTVRDELEPEEVTS